MAEYPSPVYFVLTHLWMKLFPEGGLVTLWAARSLSAILGAASIPAIFGMGWLVFARLVGQIAAAMMAVSPYGIYLAQEARHYTLAILLIIASLCCLVMATRAIHRRISTYMGGTNLGLTVWGLLFITSSPSPSVLKPWF